MHENLRSRDFSVSPSKMSYTIPPSILSSLYLSSAFKAGNIFASPIKCGASHCSPSSLSLSLPLSSGYKAGNFSSPTLPQNVMSLSTPPPPTLSLSRGCYNYVIFKTLIKAGNVLIKS
jgi:hypothetical protein